MSEITLALLEGDGIGPEITDATRKVLDVAAKRFGFTLVYKTADIGLVTLEREGTTFPEAALETALASDGVILGPVSHNIYPAPSKGGLNPSGELRKRLDLYANIRPAVTRPGVTPRGGQPLDMVIVRENTEGFYADRNMAEGPGEMLVTPDVAISLRRITRPACLRIARTAFELARSRKKHVTSVHKANVLRVSDGLYLECTRQVAAEYPDVTYDERIIDAMCAHLVREPAAYDVIVTTNMYGDILSDLASELSGSLGLAASLNSGDERAMAQAQHGSAPDIAGKNIANPVSLVGSAAMLLTWLGGRRGDPALLDAGNAIEAAIDRTMSIVEAKTPDLSGTASLSQATAAICDMLSDG